MVPIVDLEKIRNEPIISWPFYNDITTESKEDNQFPLSLISFPTSPFVHYSLEDYEDDIFLKSYNDIHQHQQQPFMEYLSAAAASIDMMEGSNRSKRNDELAENPPIETNKGKTTHILKKKSSKNDRHSKINTAQGPRDRRMRLSLEVARKFFDLQDMLGFDKASRTIEWLLFQSKSAIVELVNSLPKDGAAYGCTAAEHELLSEFDEIISNRELQKNGTSEEAPLRCSRKERKARYTCKSLARESRKKARERARERTLEKALIRRLGRFESGGELMKIFLNNRQQQQTRAQDLPSADVLAVNEKFKSSEQQNFLAMAAEQGVVDDFMELMS